MLEHQNTKVKIVVFLCARQVNVGVFAINEALLNKLNMAKMRDCKSSECRSALVEKVLLFHASIIAGFQG
jgi:hypothetical protein